MIRLIASDLDGTILQNKAQHVGHSTMGAIKELIARNILFAPASGRQLESLKKLFAPVAGELVYISENGAFVKYKDAIINKMPIERGLALEMIADIDGIDNCEVLASGERYAYIRPKTEEFYYRMTKIVNYETKLVKSFDEIDEDIIKVSVCDISGIDNSRKHFETMWKDKASVAVSGDLFLDLTAPGVNKGAGVRKIQEYFDIKPEECMAFGDNYNDIQMFESVGSSYAMQNAVEEIKNHAKYVAVSVEEVIRRSVLATEKIV